MGTLLNYYNFRGLHSASKWALKSIVLFAFSAGLASCNITSQAKTPEQQNTKTPTRIVSLKPNITEILFALGVGDSVVGVTTWCDFPEEVKNITKVADYIHADTEKIVALKPDLIVGSMENSDSKPIFNLKKLGYNILLLPFGTIDELLSSIKQLGIAVSRRKEAEKLSDDIKNYIISTKERLKDRPSLKVLVIVGRRPLVAAGAGTFLDELLKVVNAENIAAGGKMRYPRINIETLIAERPDVILNLTMGSENAKRASLDEYKKEFFSEFRSSPPQAAGEFQSRGSAFEPPIEGVRTVHLPINNFRAGPRIPSALKMLEEAIYKDE